MKWGSRLPSTACKNWRRRRTLRARKLLMTRTPTTASQRHFRLAIVGCGALLLAALLVPQLMSDPRGTQHQGTPTGPPAGPSPGPAPDGMAWVPGGTYWMGDDAFPDAAPVHRVTVDPFWMDKTEVTNAQFAEFVRATHYV